MAYERTHKPLSGVHPALKILLCFAWEHATNIFYSHKFSTLSSGGRRYYELYAVKNKTLLVLKFVRVDAVLDVHFILKNFIMGRLCCSAAWYENRVVKACTWSDRATAVVMLFAHLVFLEHLNYHQNLISSSLYHPVAGAKISSQSVHKFLSNVVHKQTDRLTDSRTNATKT